MTLGEIYTRVMWLVYGDTNYPQSTQMHMQNTSQGIILDAHKQVQQEYDFWFLEAVRLYNREQGTTRFELPDDFKSVRSVRLFGVGDTIETSDGVSIDRYGSVYGLTTEEPVYSNKRSAVFVNNRWHIITSMSSEGVYAYPKEVNSGNGTLYKISFEGKLLRKQIADKTHYDVYSYPCYNIIGNELNIYLQNSKRQIVELQYYKYYTLVGEFTSYTDAVTENAYNAIIYLAVEMEERRRREFQPAMYYRQLAIDEIQKLKKEHLRRRNNDTINYVGE